MPYIKTHSNFVLSRKHQDIKDGIIYERDITTIGVGNMPNGQTPIYRSNNFIISVRGDERPSNEHNTSKWAENDVSGTVWTLDSISGLTSEVIEDNDTKIVLKQDYYDLNDFAYYGSLTELFRTSVTDIVSRFPGELYVTEYNAYYTSAITIDGETIENRIILGDESLYYIDNPFSIDMHSLVKKEGTNELKYFADGGYNNYEIIDDNGNTSAITSWKVSSNESTKKGECAFTITLNGDSGLIVYGYVGDGCNIFYLCKKNKIHIRPQGKVINKFYNECDYFEKLLMNKDTDYEAVFSVIRENDYGYYRELVPFKFPKGQGEYNIDTSDYGFNAYTEQMVKIGEYYDEHFTDNLWRSMTHEAIKNFDWTYTREYQEGDEEEYVFGGERIQKALRLFAREFDETLAYINNIKNGNRITYDERSNIPDYFLTDEVENSGWDVKLIYPYSLVEKDNSGNTVDSYTEGGSDNYCHGQLNNTTQDGIPITREFSQDANATIIPYSGSDYQYGYFNMCTSGTVSATSLSDTVRFDPNAFGGKGVLKNVIRRYTNDVKWTYQKGNNEFLRRLKINSPYIWRSKGTIDGIEMIMGMFGLKSKRWSRGENNYDFDVTEYTSFAHRIEEEWDAIHQDYRINWINSTKTIAYDNRGISNYNKYGFDSNRIPYQGIMVAYRDEYESGDNPYIGDYKKADGSSVLKRYLYPNFEKNEQLDGNPYFQMNGGWLSKIIGNGNKKYNFQYDIDDNIVYSDYVASSDTEDNNALYKETVRNIRRVDDLNGLMAIPTNELYNGVICSVTRINRQCAVIDGLVYQIETEYNGNKSVRYISLVKRDGFIKVGQDKFFDSTIYVYDENGNEKFYNIEDREDGYLIKAYIKDDGTFMCKENNDGSYGINYFLDLDSIWVDENLTNYFILDDINYASDIARFNDSGNTYTSGWRRLFASDSEYLKINTIANYNKGNNPHNGNMRYDNGHEYFTYYQRIFKYAVDNDLFDSRCYDDYLSEIDDIGKYGFSGLINSNEAITQYDTFLKEDTKIHYFGNYKTIDDDNSSINMVWIYGDDKERLSGFNEIYASEASSISGYNLGEISTYSAETSGGTIDEVTNQIVNNKRLKIDFFLHNKWYEKSGQEEIKFLDDIVMNYLTQMIPSSTILQVQYNSKNE